MNDIVSSKIYTVRGFSFTRKEEGSTEKDTAFASARSDLLPDTTKQISIILAHSILAQMFHVDVMLNVKLVIV